MTSHQNASLLSQGRTARCSLHSVWPHRLSVWSWNQLHFFVKSKTLPFTHLQPPHSRDLSLSKTQQETNQEVRVADASAQPSYFLSQLHRTSRLCGVTLVHGCRVAAGRAVHSPGPPGRSLVPGEASCYAARPGVQTITLLTHLGHLLH